MPDIGNPIGFDLATVLTGSGLTLLLSAAILKYGSQLQYSTPKLYGIGGIGLVVVGVLFGLFLVLTGNR
ncbi:MULTISPECIES: hypothetical protein [unclassified Haladaptatus]|uniref:hypothetical protein n=1 Tax=unclassified Haladaptatus TaxID=2622732 RepID=UPI00209C43D8|nr:MULTISPECIES: hypothetical protein [unclassified Haladaptatus]MCO8245149.1 hypothetical protein [Haladaptatus sp. AB643]MCO8253292.1 hypothetical protein [Haladaptatus sp. AB618]